MRDINMIIEELKSNDKFRYKHSIGVMETAMELAEIHGEDVEKIKIAGFLHDYAKMYSNKKLREYVKEYNLDLDPMLIYTKDLCHGPVGAELIKERFNVTDEIILNSIRYHTFADRNMSKFDMILYLADLIEPNRKIFSGYHKIKKLAYTDVEAAMVVALDKSIKYIIEKGEKLYIESVELRNRLLD
ncbi:bis(5'-nucleosyl)-tetraphosphatase (symmetrical) YqeK [Clostridiaceae bacterium HSG29]|nr:bis(5'-nucleosyl)-tetraphosphatase (symmetrical) YqeK [Clostridiaceae bacterium HSG29]